jgi:biotin synthase-related radical SAM superfamily protein
VERPTEKKGAKNDVCISTIGYPATITDIFNMVLRYELRHSDASSIKELKQDIIRIKKLIIDLAAEIKQDQ